MPTPTLVLLHGQPDSSASFLGLRRALRERLPGARVLAPDRPGYGANPLGPRDFEGNVDWLMDWLPAATAGPAVVLGHSWAGGIATLAAARAPEAFAGIVLLASVGPACLQPIDPVLGAPVLGELLSWAALQLAKPVVSRTARGVIGRQQASQDLPFAHASGMAMRRRPVWRSFLLEQRALLRQLPLIEAELGRVTVPTLVIQGRQDQFIPQVTAVRLQEGIAGATLHHLDGGHDLQLRRSGAVADLVADFVRPLEQP